MSNLLTSHPIGYTLRECQVEALTMLQDNWTNYDVFILNSPVASGKSLDAITLSNWIASYNKSSAIITPQVILQDQYNREFPEVPTLKGKSRYKCHQEDIDTCSDRHELDGNYCEGCPYTEARATMRKSLTGVFNLYSYMFEALSTKSYAEVLIVDEAHSVVSQLQEFYTLRLWQHEDDYPDSINTQGDAVVWMEGHIERLEDKKDKSSILATKIKLGRKISQFRSLIAGINRDPGHFFYEKKQELHRGTKRDCIEIRPVTLQHTATSLWSHHKKIVLMSATIRPEDIEYLGLKNKHCKYFEVSSPIPAANRPIIVRPIAQMSYANQALAIPKICKEINKLLDLHPGKGIIHITYGQMAAFKKHLTSSRFLWHTQASRSKVYEEFKASTNNGVLVAAGMAEGIDLAGGEFTWQVIAKIMFPSLQDALIQRQKVKEPKWYDWQAVKTTIQQSGRICRTPTDYGVTYILDSSFVFLYRKSRMLFPQYFHDAVVWEKGGAK